MISVSPLGVQQMYLINNDMTLHMASVERTPALDKFSVLID